MIIYDIVSLSTSLASGNEGHMGILQLELERTPTLDVALLFLLHISSLFFLMNCAEPEPLLELLEQISASPGDCSD